MIDSRDWHVLLECVHSKSWNSSLLCEFPESCQGCIFHEVHGSHKVKKALKLYHDWQKYCDDLAHEVY